MLVKRAPHSPAQLATHPASPPLAKDARSGEELEVITETEALAQILARLEPLPARDVRLVQAVDAFAARDIAAAIPLPPFDNSAMDGYAVQSQSARRGARLRVVGEQAAGVDRHLAVSAGEAVRIFTGAPLPDGADAVVMQEDVERHGDEIVVQTDVAAGEFVRARGGDVAAGQKIVAAGERIRAQTIPLLAAQGFASLHVGGAATAAIISTGDELVAPGGELQPGQIYESNAIMLEVLLRRLGVCVVANRHVRDEAEAIEAAVRAGTAADVMVISGGVSVGARDFVKAALLAAGAEIDLWRVAVKPGKPFLFGRAARCAIFGLPGNPVSAFVTFLLFVRPAILQLMGANDVARQLPTATARLAEDVRNESDRPHYLRGLISSGWVQPIGRQESHALFGLSRSNALLRLDPGERLAKNDAVPVLLWE